MSVATYFQRANVAFALVVGLQYRHDFTARQLQDKCRRQHKDLFMVFVDLTKAFDTVNRNVLWKILSRLAVLVNLSI